MSDLMSKYPLTLPHAFERVERLFPHKPVVSKTQRGVERTTYGIWADRTRRLATAISTKLGIPQGANVGTFAWNTARHLELYFAVPCSGRVLHTINVRLSAEQTVYVINHAADDALFVDRSLLPTLAPLLEQFTTVRHVVVINDVADDTVAYDDPRLIDYDQLVADAAPARFDVEDERQAASICYTSGTTGRPKGVVYSHRSTILHTLGLMLADSVGVCERDVLLPIVPMFHASAWGLPHAAAMSGATLVLPGSDLSPSALADLMEGERVTVTAAVPTIWQATLEELEGRDLSALRYIASGGAALPAALAEAYQARLGLPLIQGWGMTETSPKALMNNARSTLSATSEEELAHHRATVGLPTPLVDVRIVDLDTDEELPWDGAARGELQVRGAWIASGYYGGDGATQFTTDGWLRTGDVAAIDRYGYVRIVDRTKDLVKSGGEWIPSVELENALMGHPDVREAAVVAIPDARWGERPLACVVPCAGKDLDVAMLRSFLSGQVPKWWIPERFEVLDDLPRTSVGKFAKAALRDRYQVQAPDTAGKQAAA